MKKMSDSDTGNKYDKANKGINNFKKGAGVLSTVVLVGGVAVKKGWPVVKKLIFKA